MAGAASRAISPALLPCEQQKPLAVEKLRSYVKNKKFRRLVFGVLFVNSVMRMLRTLQQNKSSHGIDYVKVFCFVDFEGGFSRSSSTESRLN